MKQAERRPPRTVESGAGQSDSPADPTVPESIRSTLLQTVGERCPAGWTVLVLHPPPHADRMIWHVHLRPNVMLDLADRRTIPTQPPEPTSEWELPNGRTAALASGDPTPAPGPSSRAVRVVGAHLSVTYERLPSPTLLVRTGEKPRQHVYRAAAVAGDALGPPLAEGLRSAIGQQKPRATDSLGYSVASWSAHEPIWLTVRGRT